jgi:hypothetical protein
MMRRPWILVFALLVIGCKQTAPSASAPDAPKGAASAWHDLAARDNRASVPLTPPMALHQKENMRDHLIAIEEILTALAARDFDTVRAAASRIGYSPETEQMCEHMGAGAEGFTERALHFHRTADRIAEAAQQGDFEGSLAAVAETLATCNSCHRTFRQELVDSAAWMGTTGTAPPSDEHAPAH